VITVAHTFIATAEAISAVGARPVFVEIDPLHLQPGPRQALAAAITPATRAIMPVHIYGQPADMDAIRCNCQPRITCRDRGCRPGARRHVERRARGDVGHAACFSFYPGKNLGAYGDAGAVTPADAAIAEQVRLLRNHGRHSKYLHDSQGLWRAHRHAAGGDPWLPSCPLSGEWTAARRRLAARYMRCWPI
jgi:dTDP-4-amino-4,6-dideoxygalactose transaminase